MFLAGGDDRGAQLMGGLLQSASAAGEAAPPVPFAQAGEHLDVVARSTSGPVRIARAAATAGRSSTTSTSSSWPTLAHGRSRNHQHLLFLQRNQDPAEHARVDARRARPGDLHLEGAAGRLRLGHDLADRAAALLVEPLDLHADLLADLEFARQRLADAGHQLHPLGIEERDQHLARA